ncbi:MAG TPA: endolytic transglycosylase MltG [Gemmatimonadaceae bacterium]|nr:endolytic transglycosylase MltG [Gemmatimonadaceae bacterium]
MRSVFRPDRRRAALGGIALAFAAACGGSGTGSAVRVTVPPRATLRVAADSLARAGVIRWPRMFRVYASLRHRDRAIKAGTYLLHRDAGYGFVLDALRGGKGLVHVVTIPEGFALSQIEPLLAARLGVPLDSLDAAVRDTALLRELDVPTPTVEGYLFPDTYVFPEHTTARTAIDMMARQFERVWQPAWTARLDTIHLSRNDVVTLASIVEKEAKLPQERPVIAAVYLNRLRDGMLLQADPTVQYALGKHVNRVLYKDLEVDSPYNTYKHKGLPPGPIASPGRPSLEAALYPANVPFEYFVAFPDGHHEFRTSIAEHDKAVAEARRAWDSVAVLRRADSLRAK